MTRLHLLTALLSLVTLAGSVAAQCPSQDPLEPNGSCQQAVAVSLPYAVTGLNTQWQDLDYFKVTVLPGQILDATITMAPVSDIATVSIVEGQSCIANLVGSTFATAVPGSPGTASWSNRTGAPLDVAVAVTSDGFSCAFYDLAISSRPDPCQPATVDALEPNDTCATAFLLQPGAFSNLSCGVASLDVDYYRVTVPVGEQVVVDLASQGTLPRLEPSFTECGLDFQQLLIEPRRLGAVNRSGAPFELAFKVYVSDFDPVGCGGYDLTVTSQPSSCATVPPDAFEPNDKCAAAVPVLPGLYSGLTLEGPGAVDWFSIPLGLGEQLAVTVDLNNPLSDVNVGVLWECISGTATFTTDTATGKRVVWANNLTFPTVAHFSIAHPFGDVLGCNQYSMQVEVSPIVNLCGVDALEGGDSCQTALPISDGRYPGLDVESWDPDFYRLDVQPGELLSVELVFDASVTDFPSLRFYSPGSNCPFGPGDLANSVQTSPRTLAAQWLNETGQVRTVTAAVGMSGDPSVCAPYEMWVTGSSTPTFLGDSFCPSNPNGSFGRAITLAEGSTSLAANDLTLRARLLSLQRFGFFVASRTRSMPQPVAEGLLCLGAPIVRLNGLVQNSGAFGQVSLPVNYGSLPMPVVAGETWNFQFWFRETNPQLGSNLSAGVTLAFVP